MKILGFNIKIEFKEPALDSRIWGSFSPTRGTIEVDNTLPREVKEETVLHEVIEAINAICDLDLDHRAITNMSAVLYQVLADNGQDISKWK